MKEKTLHLRLQGLTTEEIARKVGYSRGSIENWLREIEDNSDPPTKEKLKIIRENISKKQRITMSHIAPYQLGIIWGLGSYNESEMFFRTRHRHFLEHIQDLTDSDIAEQVDQGKHQYKLKTVMIDIDDLKGIGWTERNAEIRDIPALENYKDFLRAYIETHSSLTYYPVRNRKGKVVHQRLRLRIYGNKTLMTSLNHLLSEYSGVPIRTLQISSNNKTATITYTVLDQILAIFRYLEGDPCYEEFWEDIYFKLDNPKIPIEC